MNTLQFCSLSSGSSGNCYYLGFEERGILIDAGISARAIKRHLESIGKSMEHIMGIVVTHNHHDHIAGLQTLSKKFHIPIYTSETVWKHILRNKRQKEISRDCIRVIAPEGTFELLGMYITAFRVSHDTPEALGFYIEHDERKITVVTDLGHICPTAARYISAANFLVIESNYDRDMLLNGHYPAALKGRVQSNYGHLDNAVTAAFLAEHRNPELTHICLAHLSKDNNTPELALDTLLTILFECCEPDEILPKISVLKRNIPSELVTLT